jgi:hypothetical protein
MAYVLVSVTPSKFFGA